MISRTVPEMCGSQPDVFDAFVRIADELLPGWQKALALPPTGLRGLQTGGLCRTRAGGAMGAGTRRLMWDMALIFGRKCSCGSHVKQLPSLHEY